MGIALISLLVSCKNFMQGVDVLTGLEESIAYANADSSDIEIDGETEAIRKIVPNTGIYFKKLKPKDKLPLSLETDPDYQFIKWNCDPADSVTFDDATSPATIANIISTQSPKIRIEPTFIRRPTVTFLPADITGGQPKNTAVEVIFSQPMELNETNVSNILIEVDGVSVLDSFNAPVISEDKTSVKFTANRNNLLEVGLGTKKVKVTVRDTFYHLEGENQIKLSSDAVYVYQVNNTTNDKVKINYTCNTLQGRLSRVDRDEFYLDNEQTVTFEPAAEYQVTGWNVLFTDGSKVPQSILQTEISEDLKTIKVKVCDGSDKSVEITPVTALRPTVSFSPLNVFEMPKNTPIVITFSKPVELSKEMLDQIKIEIDSMSVRDNFQKPEVSADQKQITFKAERSKLIDISSGTKTVVITIPQSLAAIENGQKITLASDVIYAYKINNQTNDKIELNLTCAANEGVLNNAGLNTYYLDNEITTTFTENEAYQITGWTILDEEGNPVPETIIKRVISTDKRTIRLSVLDVMNGKISVSPVCCTRPVIYFVPDGTQTVEKNTNISINFSEPMELTAEDMTHIKIVSDGEDLTKHFKEPALDETKTQVTFEAKLENLIPLESGIRTIVVTVPADFYYIDEASSDHITLGKDKSFTYRINSETSEKLKLNIQNKNKETCSLNINGSFEMSIGQAQTLICNVASDYAFIEWQVFDGNKIVPKTEYQQFIDFDEQNSDTTLIVNRLTETLYTLVPYCVARPNIVSATPLYDANGVYRDRRITIMFDQPIDENTLYYTEEEMKTIKADNPDVVFLDTPEKTGKFYGYQINQNIVWKCVSITKRSDKTVNLLNCYQPPVFDTESSDIIRILPKNNENDMPPPQTEILVNVNPVFGITVPYSNTTAKKLVSFANKYPWAYRTNSKHDSDVPEITELKLYVAGADEKMEDVIDSEINGNSSSNKIFQIKQNGDKYEYSSDKLRENVFTSSKTDLSKLPDIVSKRYLVVQAKISDAGSGPKSLVGEITKVDSKNFEKPFNFYPLKENETGSGPCLSYEANLNIDGADAEIKNKIGSGNKTINAEKIDLSSLGQGLYKINFIIKDNNACELNVESDLHKLEENPIPIIYFIYDGTAPDSVTNLEEIRTAANKATINWTNSTSDYAYTKIEYKEAGDLSDDDIAGDNGYNSPVYTAHDGNGFTVEINGLTSSEEFDNRKPYKYRATAYDWAGNASAPVTFVDRTGPAKPTALTETRKWADHSVVNWTNPTDEDFANVFVECKVALLEEQDKSSYKASKTDTSTQFDGLVNLTRYVYYATAYDWSGNKSETISFTDITGPAKTTNFTGTKTIKKDKIEIKLSNFSDDYSKSELFIDGYEETGDAYTYYKTSDGIVLSGGNKVSHSVKIYDYDYSGNKSESHVHTYSAIPAVGMILYSSGYWSPEYSTQDEKGNDVGTPLGIIWDADAVTKCQVWALDETKECCWGSEGSDSFLDGNNSKYNGYNSYQTVCDSYSSYIKWTHNEHPSMWYYTYQKNNYASQKYSSLGITWFIPSVSDYNRFKEVYDVVENTINKLPETLSVPELTYDIGTTKNKSFENTYHPSITYVPNPFGDSSTEFLYLSANTSGNTGGHGIYWPVGFYSRASYSGTSYPSSFYSSKTNHFSTNNANSPVKGIIDTHSTFVRSSFYRSIAHTMGQVDLSK